MVFYYSNVVKFGFSIFSLAEKFINHTTTRGVVQEISRLRRTYAGDDYVFWRN